MSVYERSYTERDGSEFATYGDLTIEYRDASHRYWIHQGGDRATAISVTTALKVLDKPALVSWAERMGAEAAIRLERAGELAGIEPQDVLGAIRARGEGAEAKRDAGADRGTAIHEALRLYCSEGTVPKVGDFPGEVRGYVQGLCRWLIETQPEPLGVEQIVGSPTHGYAGRFDLLANIDGRRSLVDLKTSARVYAEHHLQTAAYMLALEECGEEPAERGVIVAVGVDGTFHAPDCCADPSHYLAVLGAYRALIAVRSGARAMEKVMQAPA
jgi:PD-(D/E)XK nuclease superfamily